MADGSITIDTLLATDKFDKQIADLEKKMSKEEDKKLLIEAKLDTQEQDLQRAREKTDELANAFQRLSQLKEKANKTPVEFSELQGLQQQYGSMEKLDMSFNRALDKQVALEQKVASTKLQYDGINKKVDEYKTKIETIKIQKHQADVQKISSGFKSVGSSIQEAVKRAGKLALSIFAVRSAYMALRRASSDLASYDKQYAANLEYIRFVLTQTIAPVLKWIVQLAATLLNYLYVILNAWFGIGKRIDVSANAFKKMKTSAGGVSKAVKEIKKQLSGFDEINVLQEDGSVSGGGGAGVTMPDFDIGAMEGEPTKWLQWIVDNKDIILGALAGIAAAIIAMKISDLLTKLGLIETSLSGIKALGIGLMVAGIVSAIINLIKYLKDPSFKNFGKIIQSIGVAIIGLGVAFLGLPAIIAGAIVLIVGTIIKYWDEIKAFFQKGIDWLAGKSDWIHEKFGDTIGLIYDTFVENLQGILNWFDLLFTTIKGIFDGIIKVVKGVFTGDWKMAWEGAKQIFLNIFNFILKTFLSIGDYIYRNVIVPLIARFQQMKENLVNLFRSIGTKVGEVISGAFKGVINGILKAIENILNFPIRAVNSLIGTVNTIPGVNLRKLSTFSLPRLKVGGIVNMPNKGTLVGNAVAGESGKEGVIPLTDQQAMAELGREIGKNVLINLTNITNMNGRTISRELKQIQVEQDFAYNI